MGLGRRLFYISFLGKQTITKQVTSKSARTTKEDGSPSFVLLGGELFNKGAQAMTFTVVDQLKKEFPGCDIFVFSTKDHLEDHEIQYKFEFLPWDIDIQLDAFGYRGNKFKDKDWDADTLCEIREVFRNATAILDISGYSFSAQLGIDSVLRYVTDIALAHKYGVPYYILPQSIGPFDFDISSEATVGMVLRTFLPYPELICPREQEGIEAVSKYTTDNVQLEHDLVLQCPDYDISSISDDIPTDAPTLEQDAVGIIPNRNVLNYAENDMVEIYRSLIDQTREEYHTYILRHAADDDQLCQQLYHPFRDDTQVHNLNNNYNAIQLKQIIDQFDFTVASRYHSVVHCYRAGVPAIIIGWAVKYKELAQFFDQKKYQFDCRGTVNQTRMQSRLSEMSSSYKHERACIEQRFNELQEGDDILDEVFRRIMTND